MKQESSFIISFVLSSRIKEQQMKRLTYACVFALIALNFTACSDASEKIEDSTDTTEATNDEAFDEAKRKELNKVIEHQQEAEKLNEELDEFIETL